MATRFSSWDTITPRKLALAQLFRSFSWSVSSRRHCQRTKKSSLYTLPRRRLWGTSSAPFRVFTRQIELSPFSGHQTWFAVWRSDASAHFFGKIFNDGMKIRTLSLWWFSFRSSILGCRFCMIFTALDFPINGAKREKGEHLNSTQLSAIRNWRIRDLVWDWIDFVMR